MRRAAFAVIAALVLGLAGAPAVDGGFGVTVGSARLDAEGLDRRAADRAIERLWLEGEAAARGLALDRSDAPLAVLRGAVADALVPERDARRFARAFGSFHARWRARTRCERSYHDPYRDRCSNLAGAPTGTCRWMGEATLCAAGGDRRRRWLVVRDARPVIRLRSRARAVRIALALYWSARVRRVAEARRARARREAEAAARERAARRRDPHLSAPALAAARAACARQAADSDPYMFGFGMQDAVGGAEGLIAARTALARRLDGAAGDVYDRRKLRPLVRAVHAGNRELARLAAAATAGDDGAAAAVLARLDARTEPERALARGLDLGDCLVRPAR